MPQKKRQSARKSEPKVFRCTGFGDCNMVFTRSEHLARHARKHTGEKPFKCIVPYCDRMFSRFDNMMQHTHTHSRTKKKDSSDSSAEMTSPKSMPDNNATMYVPALPSSPISSFNEHQVLPRCSDKPTAHYAQPYCQTMRPPSPVSDEDNGKCQTQPTWNQTYTTSTSPQSYHSVPGDVSIPPTPTYSSCSSENGSYYQPRQYSPESAPSPTDYRRKSPVQSETQHKRRLSREELFSPIQELNSPHYYSPPSAQKDQSSFSFDNGHHKRRKYTHPNATTSTYKSMDGVDVTQDEYEALQGFSKFCAEPVVNKKDSPIILPSLNESRTIALTLYANLFAQVHAFRQLVPTVPESFQRDSN